jgi:DNA (cytosine-5)-methyltransferase 1
MPFVPLQMVKPTVISTFAGGGGSSLGYQWAGFKELLAIEWDKNAVETLQANFDFPVRQRDICEVTADEILSFCKIKKGELDVLDGSPPCQGFSTSGKRDLNDERNDLFKQFVRLIEGLQPKVFVMENVSGMIKGKMKGKFNEILKSLKDTGYNVKCKLMNAMWYEVPQSRERVFFIGVRKDLNTEPSFPEPLKTFITVKDALENCIPNETPNLNDKYGKLWDKIKVGGNAGDVLGVGQNSCVKINPDKPSCTLPKLQTGRGYATIAHWQEQRPLAINEAKILCSFPESYILHGEYSEQWARLGNAVMPKMMYHIAKNIKENILKKT